jgi:hypothetical protein
MRYVESKERNTPSVIIKERSNPSVVIKERINPSVIIRERSPPSLNSVVTLDKTGHSQVALKLKCFPINLCIINPVVYITTKCFLLMCFHIFTFPLMPALF